MKLQCQVEVINRLHSSYNIKSGGKLKSTLALGKEPKNDKEFFIIHFSSTNKTGVKYKVKCMKQVFVKCLNEGKVTIRFEEPPHDLCITSEPIQLKCFMKLLKHCITGESKTQLSNLSNISVTAKDIAPRKLVIRDRSEIPSKGLPRTLEALTMAGLNLCNFRREVLMLKQLVVLDLSNNEMQKIPSELGRMPILAELHLANNKLGMEEKVDWRWLLGPQITSSLRLLDLSGNKLTQLPKGIWKLQKLITLKLDNNEFKGLPSTLGRIQSLRYLTISQNKLESLPSSLMHRPLEQIDLSSNHFDHFGEQTIAKKHTVWEFCVGSLVNLSAKVVLKKKLYYAPNIVPFTLVEFLDNANVCICGCPVTNDIFFIKKMFNPKEFFRTVVANNRTGLVTFECFFCSYDCFMRC